MAAAISRLQHYPGSSSQAHFVRDALVFWARRAKLVDTGGKPTPEQIDFLRTFDLGYGQRRLTFVIGRAAGYYTPPKDDDRESVDRKLLNELKHGLYGLASELQTVLNRSEADFLGPAVAEVFAEQELRDYLGRWELQRFVDDHQAKIEAMREQLSGYLAKALEGFGERAYAELVRLTEQFPEKARDDLRARYIGFPYWDQTTYPARVVSDVVELDEVAVVRVSPLDTDRLTPLDADGKPNKRLKLRGVAIGHFGAFFRRSWRENDYLWGRLDGAQRLLWLLGDDGDDSAKAAFRAIAAEERSQLTNVPGLLAAVQRYAGSG
jgi:hypothetical protein